MSIEACLALISLEHVEHIGVILVLSLCHYNAHCRSTRMQSSYPANTVVYCAWFILCKACGFRIDSLQRVCRSWVSVNGAVHDKVLVFGDVANVGNETFRVSSRLSHW
jgi:hypothetical protein